MEQNKIRPDEIPAPMKPKKKKGKGCLIAIACFVGFLIIGMLIQWITVGPARGDRAVEQKLTSLRKDSVELNETYKPAAYSHPTDINKAVERIEDLGRPWRVDASDSAFYADDPRTAAIFRYNVEKSKQVLEETLPSWRRAYALAISTSAKRNDEMTVAKTGGDDAEELFIYTPSFVDPKERESYYTKHAGAFVRLGFKKVVLGLAPTSEIGETYTF